MDLSPYVDALRRELVVAAEAGGDDARELAERLTASLESAARLSLLEALSAAADEVTRDLAPGSVEVRLRGRDPEFVVTAPPPESPAGPAEGDLGGLSPAPAPPADADEGATTRLTLRLPTHLKPRIDEAANRAGLSVNAWLVRALAALLDPEARSRTADPTAGTPFGRRYTGWVR